MEKQHLSNELLFATPILNVNGCITRTDYETMTGQTKYQAVADLNRYLSEGLIRKYGSRKTVVYLKPNIS